MSVPQAPIAERYRLLQLLGSGGMGRVWLSRDEVLHRDVAIKEVRFPDGLSPAEMELMRARTLREAQTAARLSHPNVVQIYDVLRTDDQPWIVMEYVRARSLQQIISQDGPLSPERAAEIGLAVLFALTAAHRAGVLHRDVKPGNVLIADDGRVVLTDFGLATFDGGQGSVTRPGLVWGSPEYVSPERAKMGVSSVEADLWSLGATLYAAVEGHSPYARPSAMATLTALATEKPAPPQHAGALRPVLAGLLRKDPKARIGPAEVERLLTRVVDPSSRPRPRRLPRQRPVQVASAEPDSAPAVQIISDELPDAVPVPVSPPAAPPPEPTARGPSRRGWLAAIAVVLLVVLTAGGALIYADRNNDPGGGPTGLAGGDGVAASAPAGTPVPTSSRLPQESDVPPGWVFYQDPAGFRIGLPAGWLLSREGNTVTFREPNTVQALTVELIRPPAGDPMAAVLQREQEWSKSGQPRNYQRVRIDPVVIHRGGVEWTYTYNDEHDNPLHVISRRFVVNNGWGYTISWTNRNYAGNNRTQFDIALAAFRPIP